ncbi:hypothetical protein [Streptomyces apricus]|uniref:Uncharacterized protein n=1 Tax=Streptomyces apricus TaxID=1828112 RepID=A0A5B0AKF9_9ACTN|nr:hypothetical protein [Streptomyces apricus]KAA0930310.1 hypothetical protein FGF04_27205 [Streptomyces apricus]
MSAPQGLRGLGALTALSGLIRAERRGVSRWRGQAWLRAWHACCRVGPEAIAEIAATVRSA